MITIKSNTINNITFLKPITIVSYINAKIKEEQQNSLGITILLIMANTMIASIAAALAIEDNFSVFCLAFTCISAMGTNAVAFSQRSFASIVWSALISIIGNTTLIAYLTFTLFL